jgi:hypothetical protein
MGIGDRLIARPSIDFWDFQESTIGFFLHHIAILGTCACAAHYAVVWLRGVIRVPARVIFALAVMLWR